MSSEEEEEGEAEAIEDERVPMASKQILAADLILYVRSRCHCVATFLFIEKKKKIHIYTLPAAVRHKRCLPMSPYFLSGKAHAWPETYVATVLISIATPD